VILLEGKESASLKYSNIFVSASSPDGHSRPVNEKGQISSVTCCICKCCVLNVSVLVTMMWQVSYVIFHCLFVILWLQWLNGIRCVCSSYNRMAWTCNGKMGLKSLNDWQFEMEVLSVISGTQFKQVHRHETNDSSFQMNFGTTNAGQHYWKPPTVTGKISTIMNLAEKKMKRPVNAPVGT